MRRRKSVTGIIAAVMMMAVLCLCMAGCGSSDDNSDAAVIGKCTVSISDQLKKTEFDINEGDTVYDILEKTGQPVSAKDTGNGLAIEAIGGVASGDMGKNSGWLFTVNGEMAMDYCDRIEVSDGDEIVWDFVEGM